MSAAGLLACATCGCGGTCTPTCLTNAASSSIVEVYCSGFCLVNSQLQWEVTEYPATIYGGTDDEMNISIVGGTTGTVARSNTAASCAQTATGVRIVIPIYTEQYTQATNTYTFTRDDDYVWETLSDEGLPGVQVDLPSTSVEDILPFMTWSFLAWGSNSQQTLTLGHAYAGVSQQGGIGELVGFPWQTGQSVATSLTPIPFTAIGQTGSDSRTTAADTYVGIAGTDTFRETTITQTKVILSLSDVTLVDAAAPTNVGCVNCPRVLDVLVEVDLPGDYFFDIPTSPTGDVHEVIQATFTQKCRTAEDLSSVLPHECVWLGTYSGYDARVRKIASRLYVVEAFNLVSPGWRVLAFWKTSGDCPTSVTSAPSVRGAWYSAISGSVDLGNLVYTKHFIASPMTVTVTAGTDTSECECDCPLADDLYVLTVKCDSLHLAGFTGIEVERDASNPCIWTGTNGTWDARVEFVDGTWTAEVVRTSAPAEVLIDAIWTAPSRNPTGTHSYAGTGTGYPTSSDQFLDEQCGSLAIEIS